jgi:hypothetical protein
VALPGSAYSADASPAHAACGARVASSSDVDSRPTGRAVRAAVPASRCHGFSPWQLRSHSLGAVRSPPLVSRLALTADPLRPSAEGAAPDGVISDVLMSPGRRCCEISRIPPSPRRRLRFRWTTPLDRWAKDTVWSHRVRVTSRRCPGRLPSTRGSAPHFDETEWAILHVHLWVHAPMSRTLVARREMDPPRS